MSQTLEGARECMNETRTCTEIGPDLTQPCSLDVPELRRHLKMSHMTAAPILRPHLSNLEQMLKSWDAGGNRMHLAGNIERTIRAIETLRQPAA
jgi:hypothetical protein